MQQPSLQNVRIRSTRDALHIFYAVARKALPLITRRLDAEERRAIIPGNVYVWEERSANSEATGLGMERWTDGMGWGPSRVRDEFLFYHQKECDISDDPSSAATPWAQMISMYPSPRSRATSESERLIKQTYSVRVSLPEDRPRGISRKWHLTAYFSQQKLDRLNTVDNISGIGDVPVPDGWFRSARRDGKSRRDEDLPKSVAAKQMSQAPMEGVIDGMHASESTFQSSFYQLQSSPAAVYAHFPSSGASSQVELLSSITRKTAHSLPSSTDYYPAHLSAAVRQTTYSAPNIVPAQIHSQYRTSPPLHSHSTCPSPPSTSSVPATPSPRINPHHLSEQLVPLEYLQNLSYPRRDPIDEQFLQRFSTQTLTSSHLPSKGGSRGHSPSFDHLPSDKLGSF
ncbi:hypothetical protein BV22DRAFT_1194519 [Leucogyrophana mollusca]|uniref:Uncharacterized protein n=1 Tax=Leucogyrophana mollusca TaxID=85980 RepID=A0ACB8BKI6_9AGAM|nr:hypothetical protein BV22DRAFT_1194519 [Leucogyrophana mollusca]